uniref:Fibronectin type-III domain-containing protein n=1 Tax=Branchiostoma floridae TaxID=7739 RepID=C3ZG56_BRAFL|eukprot:XP_002592520.1 hypothetical protein BRAFLDRAFT_69036 [Branchiostoma floridae]
MAVDLAKNAGFDREVVRTRRSDQQEYFSSLLCKDKRSHEALEMLVSDLHADKEGTVSTFLSHSGSEDFLWGLVRLLDTDNPRVGGNAAYILGTIAENELGAARVLSLTNGKAGEQILDDLTNMLMLTDAESVMNAAGTIGTLAESSEGRDWMLGEPHLDNTVSNVTNLLTSNNQWIASNAALVLARLTISETGCNRILDHESSELVLTKLVLSLGVDKAGLGMNSAFAVGRLCDMEPGRSRLLSLPDSEKMFTSLGKMLCHGDTGSSKNACFAVSCLATSPDGHARLLGSRSCNELLTALGHLLKAEDGETGWFAAMTLRTLASVGKGVVRLRDHAEVLRSLKEMESREDVSPDLRDEVITTLEILKRLERPEAPRIEVRGSHSCEAAWEASTTKSGLPITYRLYEGNRIAYRGADLHCVVDGLQPYTQYSFRLQAATEGDGSPQSDPVIVRTEESIPGEPTGLRVINATTTQLKVCWSQPLRPNGVIKGYAVYQGKTQTESTQELSSIISGLQPQTTYDIHVCAITNKGKGPRSSVKGRTEDLGAHAPEKPSLTVQGRHEVFATWDLPEVLLGRLTKFELHVNGKIVYSGTDRSFKVTRLKPDTDYSVTVVAVTNQGKCESEASKVRTAKDEYSSASGGPLHVPKQLPVETKDLDQVSVGGGSKKKMSHTWDGPKTNRVSTPTRAHRERGKTMSASSSGSGDSRNPERVTRSKSYDSGFSDYKDKPVRVKYTTKPTPVLQPLPMAQASSTDLTEDLTSVQPVHIEAVNQKAYEAFARQNRPETPKGAAGSKTKVRSYWKEPVKNSEMYKPNVKLEKLRPWPPELGNGKRVVSPPSRKDSSSPKQEQGKDQSPKYTSPARVQFIDNKKGHESKVAEDDTKRQVRTRERPNGTRRPSSQETLESNGGQRTPTSPKVTTFSPDIPQHRKGSGNHRYAAANSETGDSHVQRHHREHLSSGHQNHTDGKHSRGSSGSVHYVTMDTMSAFPDDGTGQDYVDGFPPEMGELQEAFRDGRTCEPRGDSRKGSWDYGRSSSEDVRAGNSFIDSKDGRVFNRRTQDPTVEISVGKGFAAVPSSYVQRTEAFIKTHRPAVRKSLISNFPPTRMVPPHSLGVGGNKSMWQPEFPSRPLEKSNSNKFVPMQYRTQPLNMPTPGLHREGTIPNLFSKSAFLQKLEALGYTGSKANLRPMYDSTPEKKPGAKAATTEKDRSPPAHLKTSKDPHLHASCQYSPALQHSLTAHHNRHAVPVVTESVCVPTTSPSPDHVLQSPS